MTIWNINKTVRRHYRKQKARKDNYMMLSMSNKYDKHIKIVIDGVPKVKMYIDDNVAHTHRVRLHYEDESRNFGNTLFYNERHTAQGIFELLANKQKKVREIYLASKV